MAEKQFVIFTLGKEEYCINIISVQEIIHPPKITKLPNTPPHIMGITNLRGSVIPIIDLRLRFNLDVTFETESNRIIIVKHENSFLGIKVDAVQEVLRFSDSDIEGCSDICNGIEQQYIEGVAKIGERLIILLKLSEVI